MMVGVLGLQGDFEAHCKMLERAGEEVCVVKKPQELTKLKSLVIPGGESTTLIRLMELCGFWNALHQFYQEGKAIFGTCAGMILLAQKVKNPTQKSLGLIDVTVERNSYGRQRESFETTGTFFEADGRSVEIPLVFIRAPRIQQLGSKVKPLGFWNDESIIARQDRILVASFHPELTDDLTVHQYFLKMAGDQ